MILFHSYISSWVVRHIIVGNGKFHFSYNQTGLDITKGLSTPLDLLWNILETWEDDLHKGEDRPFMGCLNSSASFLIIRLSELLAFSKHFSSSLSLSSSSSYCSSFLSSPLFFDFHFPLCNTFPFQLSHSAQHSNLCSQLSPIFFQPRYFRLQSLDPGTLSTLLPFLRAFPCKECLDFPFPSLPLSFFTFLFKTLLLQNHVSHLYN